MLSLQQKLPKLVLTDFVNKIFVKNSSVEAKNTQNEIFRMYETFWKDLEIVLEYPMYNIGDEKILSSFFFIKW